MNASVNSVFPEKYRVLSGSALKMIAVITMLIDHIGAVLLSMYQPLRKTKCVFYAFPRISGLLCHRIFPDQTFDAASLHPGTACCFHFSESRLWMAGVYLPADHILYAKR